MNCHNPDLDEHNYLQVIHYKTAKLFEAATRLGAILGGATPGQEQAGADYGLHLGTAFQLTDDLLSDAGKTKAPAKSAWAALPEATPPLPFFNEKKPGSPAESALVRKA